MCRKPKVSLGNPLSLETVGKKSSARHRYELQLHISYNYNRLTCFCSTTDKCKNRPKTEEESKSWPSAGNLWRELISLMTVQHYEMACPHKI